jgi:hypothetical protein
MPFGCAQDRLRFAQHDRREPSYSNFQLPTPIVDGPGAGN